MSDSEDRQFATQKLPSVWIFHIVVFALYLLLSSLQFIFNRFVKYQVRRISGESISSEFNLINLHSMSEVNLCSSSLKCQIMNHKRDENYWLNSCFARDKKPKKTTTLNWRRKCRTNILIMRSNSTWSTSDRQQLPKRTIDFRCFVSLASMTFKFQYKIRQFFNWMWIWLKWHMKDTFVELYNHKQSQRMYQMTSHRSIANDCDCNLTCDWVREIQYDRIFSDAKLPAKNTEKYVDSDNLISSWSMIFACTTVAVCFGLQFIESAGRNL